MTERQKTHEGSRFDIGMVLRYGSLLLGGLMLIKAYGVAHFSLTTTGSLVTTAPLSTLLGTLASYGYLILPLLTVGLMLWLWENRVTAGALAPIVMAVAIVSVLLSPWPYLWPAVVIVVLVVLGAAVVNRLRLKRGRVRISTPAVYASSIALITAGFLLWSLDKPWVPAEVIAIKEPLLADPTGSLPNPTPTVYVIGTTGDWLTVLVENTRKIVYIPSSRVTARIVCHEGGQLSGRRPLLYVFDRKRYSSPNLSCARVRQAIREGSPP